MHLFPSALVSVCTAALLLAGCNEVTVEPTDDMDTPGAPPDMLGGPDLGDGGNPSLTTLELLAGRLGGLGNADDVGRDARFSFPSGAALDGAGHLYIADSLNRTIRKLDLASGQVTTLAGKAGVSGSDDGIGAQARFANPQSLVYDGVGRLYVSDSDSNIIRQIDLGSASVTTIAGWPGMRGSDEGIGASARFSAPVGLALDGGGNLYICDLGNTTIRRLELATFTVSTIAGKAGMPGNANDKGAAARFASPSAIVLDGTGNAYISDIDNHSIRKLVLSGADVTTVAGGGPSSTGSEDGVGAAARFNVPGGLALDGAGHLLVADASNDHHNLVRQIDLQTRTVTTLAGAVGSSGSDDGLGAAARFAYPAGLAFDGNALFLVDSLNHNVRKVTLDGAVTTLAGEAPHTGAADGASALFDLPDGVAWDGAGGVLVADQNNATIRRIELSTSIVSTPAGAVDHPGSLDGNGTAAQFFRPLSLVQTGGVMVIGDSSNRTLRTLAPNGDVVTLAGAANQPVARIDALGDLARFGDVGRLASDGAGEIYVADPQNRAVRKVVLATGLVSTLHGAGEVALQFDRPTGLALDGAGGLFVSDRSHHTIVRVTLADGTVTPWAGTADLAGSADGPAATASFNAPDGLACDGKTLYVADSGNATVRTIDLASRVVGTLVGVAGRAGVKPGPLPARLNRPRALTLLPHGGLAISDEQAIVIVR